MTEQEDKDAIAKALTEWGAAFSSEPIDVEGMKAIWDETFEHPVYQPEEFFEPWTSWAEIRAYWERVPDLIKVRGFAPIDMDINVHGDVAWVWVRAYATLMMLKDGNRMLDGQARMTYVFRRRNDGQWKVIHYHESRPTHPSIEEALGPPPNSPEEAADRNSKS